MSRFLPSRRLIWLGLRLGVTIGVCWWIATHVEWRVLGRHLRDADPAALLLVIGIQFAGIVLSSYKWQQLLLVHRIAHPLWHLTRWYFIATFWSRFLPTNIGGDGYRVYKTMNNARPRVCAVLAVFADRFSGLMALLLIGYIAAVISWLRADHPLSASLAGLGTAGLLASAFIPLVLPGSTLMRKFTSSRICPKPLASLIEHAGEYLHHRRKLATVTAISLLFHGARILSMWLLVRAVGASSGAAELAIALAAVTVVGLLPISIGGLGVAEGAFIVVMVQYGLDQEAALSAMLLARALVLPTFVVGAGLYFWGERERLPRQAAQDVAAASRGDGTATRA